MHYIKMGPSFCLNFGGLNRPHLQFHLKAGLGDVTMTEDERDEKERRGENKERIFAIQLNLLTSPN